MNGNIYFHITFPQKLKKTTLADMLVKYIFISIHILYEWNCSMDRALCPVIAKVRVLFQPLRLFIHL